VTVPSTRPPSAEQVEWILEDSGARAVVAETPDHVARVTEVRATAHELNHVWSIDDNAVERAHRLGEDIADEELEQRRTTAGPATWPR
jgi:long-chain acyl-CoA synthetase